ncbi:MAG TPA: hypothetical protein DEO86_11235 [Colwellia sp.]|nr:hypothetical protein [Colwellia sp.]|tara:strand:- start:1410 stop:1613 length:204 start_codon:yes stop_codon:yes gene_type:complete
MSDTWGKKIRKLRNEKKETLQSLGEKAGMSKHYLSCLERDIHMPKINTVERVINALEHDLKIEKRKS